MNVDVNNNSETRGLHERVMLAALTGFLANPNIKESWRDSYENATTFADQTIKEHTRRGMQHAK